jgi:hypothetical protein
MKKSLHLTAMLLVLILVTGLGCSMTSTSDVMAQVEGMIVDAERYVGISGANVTAGIYSTTTDALGEYSLTMPSGDVIFLVTALGYKNQSKYIVIKPGKNILNFGLVEHFYMNGSTTTVVQGTVVNEKTIEPIEGASLVFTAMGKSYKVVSVHLGAYSIELPTDFSAEVKTSYSVLVTAKGYQDYSGSVTVWSQGYYTNNILMKP